MNHRITDWAQWPGAGLHAGKCECGAAAAFDTLDELNTWITEHEETP
ncbi:hypothetical protein [Rothia koreensis]